MRVTFVVNDTRGLRPGQTTTALAAECAARGLDTGLVAVDGLGMRPDGTVFGHRVPVPAVPAAALPGALQAAKGRIEALGPHERVFMRTNPGRDPRPWAHATALDLLRVAAERGTVVRNDPTALARARSKLFLHALPEAIRPRTLVSRDVGELRAFLSDCPGGGVLKPLDGTQGRDVFRVRAGSTDNLGQILDLLTRDGFCMAQSFVPEAMQGDVRLILVHGRLIEVEGVAAAVRRVPQGEDFRSNVHVGGRPQLEVPSPALRAVAEQAGAALVAQGIFLCGLDVIGRHVVEANVYSPGGLTDAGDFAGVDFVGAMVDAFLAE